MNERLKIGEKLKAPIEFSFDFCKRWKSYHEFDVASLALLHGGAIGNTTKAIAAGWNGNIEEGLIRCVINIPLYVFGLFLMDDMRERSIERDRLKSLY
jgi:hypothetical protein